MTPNKPVRPRILVIDDDVTIRAMLETGLGTHYDVVCLPSGDEVIKTIERDQPNLLLLDVNIAGDDGYEICERVRAQEEFKRLPILFMTIRTGDEAFVKSLAAGGDAHIEKPFAIPALRAKIDYLLKAACL